MFFISKGEGILLEYLKYLSPLIGVLFGALIAPYMDFRRSKKESRHALKCFRAELNDYLIDSPKYAKGFHDGYMKSKKVEMGVINKEEHLFPLYFYPKIEFLTIQNLIEKSFLDLTQDQRKAVKALKIMSDHINKSTDKLSKLRTVVDFKENKVEFCSATTTSASFYYLLSRMVLEEDRFSYFEITTEDISKKSMAALNISFDDSIFENAHNNKQHGTP